jgi:hypothetical protein
MAPIDASHSIVVAALGNTVFAVGLVVLTKRLVVPFPARNSTRSRIRRLTVGGVCILLAVLSSMVALAPGRKPPLLDGAAAVPAIAFYISSLCYAVCGWVLVRSAARKRQQPPLTP